MGPVLDPSICPGCGFKGLSVGEKTIRSLLKDIFHTEINNTPYHFCSHRECTVVYFSEGSVFTKDKLKIKVGLKEREPPIPVCYCFGITKEDIEREINEKGFSTASERIRKKVKGGICSCEVKNPSGRCCLGDVIKTEKESKSII
ncbi:MAG: copper chaperone Copz family protein [Candidatus Omnitrophica bacterium]|nr:copper chaperone Copz family protein [Candidatus Omnitrophota bacterium]